MIFLTNEHVQQVLDMPTCLRAMEDAYHELERRARRLPAAHRFLRARGTALLSLGYYGGRVAQARCVCDPHEVRHARLGRAGRI